MRLLLICSVTLSFVFQAFPSFASPAACGRNTVDKFIFADLVVKAKVVQSRRWKEGMATLPLVAQYQVLEVFKGDAKKDSLLIATTTCLERSRPKNDLEYFNPTSTPFCPGGINIHLTGVDSDTGQPKGKEENAPPYWILFLKKDFSKENAHLTWTEVPIGNYYRSGRERYPQRTARGISPNDGAEGKL